MTRAFRWRAWVAVVALLALAGETFADGASAIDNLNVFYRVPSVIGTKPESVKWSDQGRTIAFSWNDRGGKYRDIWTLTAGTGAKRQLTTHDDAQTDPAAVGITELQWVGQNRIVYALNGGVYSVDLDGRSQLIKSFDKQITQLDVSPDGAYASCVVAGELWIVEIGKADSARQVVSGEGDDVAVSSYQWSHNSKDLAFVLRDERSLKRVSVQYFAEGREHSKSFSRPRGGDETARFKIGVVRVADGHRTMFERSDEHDPIFDYGWAGSDQALVVDSSDFLTRHRAITVYDTRSAGATVYFTSSSRDPGWIPSWSTAWAPGDKGLIVLSDHEGFYQLYHVPKAGSTPVALTQGAWEVASFDVDRQHGQIYFVANKDHVTDRQLYRVALRPNAKVERISSAAGTYEPVYAPDFSRVAFVFSDDQTPPDLYLQNLRGAKSPTQVTQSPLKEFGDFEWQQVQYVDFPSHVDGARIYGRLSVPKDFDRSKRYPLIVGPVYYDTVRNQWGGRTDHPTWGLDQVLVEEGYLVLSVNIRGSWGQGKAFRDAPREFGGLDIDDIESGVRYLISQGYVDPSRVGIWGSSYGGLMAAMSLFKKPGLYAAGIAGAPATNAWSYSSMQMRVMGEPKGDDYPERYHRQSPVEYVAGLKDPFMLIQSTGDTIVPYTDTLTMVEKLIANDKVFELVTLPGGNHFWGYDSPERTRFTYRKMIEFFNQHLYATCRRLQ